MKNINRLQIALVKKIRSKWFTDPQKHLNSIKPTYNNACLSQ